MWGTFWYVKNYEGTASAPAFEWLEEPLAGDTLAGVFLGKKQAGYLMFQTYNDRDFDSAISYLIFDLKTRILSKIRRIIDML